MGVILLDRSPFLVFCSSERVARNPICRGRLANARRSVSMSRVYPRTRGNGLKAREPVAIETRMTPPHGDIVDAGLPRRVDAAERLLGGAVTPSSYASSTRVEMRS